MIDNDQPCPCGTQLAYGACCGRYHSGTALPADAASLMRSRYTAYAQRLSDYLLTTWHPDTRPAQLDWRDGENAWIQLDIVRTQAGGPADAEGIVEFKAWRLHAGRKQCLHETSRFRRLQERWHYLDGDIHPTPASAKPGRNEPCPCGSGKKYKHCCGNG